MERKAECKNSQREKKGEPEQQKLDRKGKESSNSKSDQIQRIDVEEEIQMDAEFLKDLAIICHFIGPQIDRRKIEGWIKVAWNTPHITKFMPRGFFIVIFATKEERLKVLEGGLWKMEDKPLYLQRWHRNFDPWKTDPYNKPMWIRLNNLPLEYWTKEALTKIGRSLGTLINIDSENVLGDSYKYARLQLAAVKKIPSQIKLCAFGMEWIQSVKIEEQHFFCSNCGRRNHSSLNSRIQKREDKEWRPIRKEKEEGKDQILRIESNKRGDEKQMDILQPEGRVVQTDTTIGENLETGEKVEDALIRALSKNEEISDVESEEDKIGITDKRSIKQSMIMITKKPKSNRGRKLNKAKREEEAKEKGLVSVSDFFRRKSTKGVQGSLGKQ
ncbi:hypothetical protein SUGI_0674700 [Cryptomeria japonica]|nr:hypothetical protein SUGI_0674700 [Cryptomeria japonica]